MRRKNKFLSIVRNTSLCLAAKINILYQIHIKENIGGRIMGNIISSVVINQITVKEGRKEPISLMAGQRVEIQHRTDGTLLFGHLAHEKYDKERTSLIEHIANENNIEVAGWGSAFKKEFKSDAKFSDVYLSLPTIVSSLVQFEHDQTLMRTISAKVPTDIANRLKTEKNASETIRVALEKHFAAESNKQT
jgi:hypothetical protein